MIDDLIVSEHQRV